MNKRGVSEIIAYVLLMAVVISISVIVYQWLKSYVPQQALKCSDSVSVSIPNLNCSSNILNFSIENTGTFSIVGYYIKATNDSSQQVATLDLTPYFQNGISDGFREGNSIGFGVRNNTWLPGVEEMTNYYNLSYMGPQRTQKQFVGTVKSIEITPMMYVDYKGQRILAACTNSIIDEPVSCS